MAAKRTGLNRLLRLAALGLPVLSGCADPWEDPDALPFRLVPVEEVPYPGVVTDLDRDGEDELLLYDLPHEPGVGSLMIRTSSGRTIEQVNVAATVLRPTALDLDGDDPLEILLPFVRDDSLFVFALDHEGRRLATRFLATGETRQAPEGVLPWMPTLVWFAMEDVNGDGRRELVTMLRTGFARAPRGVLVHTWPEGEKVREALVGASPGLPAGFTDYDGDGVRELDFDTYASNNGAAAGGLDDQHHYVGVFDVAPRPALRWSDALGGLRTHTDLHEADLDGDGALELFVAVRNVDTGEGRVEVRDPVDGRVRRARTLTQRQARVVRLHPDAPPSAVVLQPDGALLVLDAALQTVRAYRAPVPVQGFVVSPDLDGDGADGLFVRSGQVYYWLGADFQLKASVASIPVLPLPVRQRVEERPLLAFDSSRKTQLFRIEPNRWYLAHRYGGAALGLLALGLVLGGGGALRRLRRRNRRLEAALAENGGRGGFDDRAWRLTARRVAHDLRNPLTSILLNVEHLRRAAVRGNGTSGEDVARYAARIEERVEHLRRVTRNFLKFVDVEAPTLADLDLAAFLRDQAKGIQTGLPPDIRLDVRTDGALPVRADAEQLASVLDNLAANAVNALPEGGRIVLSAYPARALQLGDDPAPRDWAVVEVRDSGVGIPEALRARLFEPGVSGTDGGAGFGLAVVQKIVADHGGRVEVETEEGVGTVFCIYLPARPL